MPGPAMEPSLVDDSDSISIWPMWDSDSMNPGVTKPPSKLYTLAPAGTVQAAPAPMHVTTPLVMRMVAAVMGDAASGSWWYTVTPVMAMLAAPAMHTGPPDVVSWGGVRGSEVG